MGMLDEAVLGGESSESSSSATAPPPPYQEYVPQQQQQLPTAQPSREDRFGAIIRKYEITRLFASKLQKLNAFKIVFVFDDSGSMSTTLVESPLNHGLMQASRWDELKYFSNICIEMANIFNPEGCDVHFLNRPVARNVKTPEDLFPYMVNTPGGYTPLTRVVTKVMRENSLQVLMEKKLLVIIVTDGKIILIRVVTKKKCCGDSYFFQSKKI
jgi:hypothetical protein